MGEKNGLFDAAIDLELKMKELYECYATIFKEDEDFWRGLAKEEMSHAKLIESAFGMPDKFPDDMVAGDAGDFKKVIQEAEQTIQAYATGKPSKEEAYKKAIYFENASGELHYQRMAQKSGTMTDQEELFQRLNKDDKDHAVRIHNKLK